MLRLDHVTFAYPGQQTPYDFDLTLAPGEILAITGVSGSGKSTLLDLTAGFLKPQSGRITLAGKSLTKLPPQDRPVSILFQADNLFDHLTVARNLALGLPANLQEAERNQRIADVLGEVGLPGLENRRASNLSGGQKQRVALARTLLRGTPVLLLDEPFAALDPEMADSMRALVQQLTRAHDWHVIVVTHDEKDVNTFATRHLHLENGVLNPVVAQDTAAH